MKTRKTRKGMGKDRFRLGMPPRRWPDHEVARLIELWPTFANLPDSERIGSCARAMGKTYGCIRQKVNLLGLREKRPHGDISNPSGELPARPTAALPGTEAKLLAMIERRSRGESLFHPRDGIRCEG